MTHEWMQTLIILYIPQPSAILCVLTLNFQLHFLSVVETILRYLVQVSYLVTSFKFVTIDRITSFLLVSVSQ